MGDEKRAWRGRRDARWMWTPLFIALGSGVFGFLLVWAAVLWKFNQTGELSRPLVFILPYAVFFGLVLALSGLVSSLPVGPVLTFLVGDARGPAAKRAAVLAAVLTEVVFGGLFVVALGWMGPGFLFWLLVVTVGAGAIAGWWHDQLPPRPRQVGPEPTRLSTWPS